MRLGILTDIHAGFHRYTKTNDKGVNVREADFYRAATDAVENLVGAGAEAIVDLGDLADTPHPRKRAVAFLIDLINGAGVPWYSVDGNHTKVRMSGDWHLYEFLEKHCRKFHGYREASWVGPIGAVLIPYGTSEEINLALQSSADQEPDWIGGHFACDDVLPDGADVSTSDLPEGCPVFLGHYHGRSVPFPAINGRAASLKTLGATGPPVYIGATERKAWGESQNPTGAAVYDTDSKVLTFIDHKVRDWIDLSATPEDYLDVVSDAIAGREDQPLMRLTIAATREEYRNVDELQAHRIAQAALDLQIRRLPTEEEQAAVPEEPPQFSLGDDWRSHLAAASIPDRVDRSEVERVGVDALSAVGVAA